MRLPASIARSAIASFLAMAGSPASAVDPPPAPAVSSYQDEESGRQVILREPSPPAVEVEVRWPGDPGFPYRWLGKGTREENRLVFTRIVGEEEDPGAKFEAKVGSRLQIVFAPGQTEPADEGILGEFRRLSEEKRRSLAMRELKDAESALTKVQREWLGAKDPTVAEWNRRWPGLRTRWIGRNTLKPAGDPAILDRDPDHWISLVEATGQAISFFNQPPPEAPMPPDGSGNYADGFGGSVSLRARTDGSYRLGFGWQRGDLEAMGSEFSFDLPANEVKRVRDSDDWSADFIPADPAVPEGEPRARIRLVKSGPFLWAEAIDASRYTGPGWLDGVYRWGPIPVEG